MSAPSPDLGFGWNMPGVPSPPAIPDVPGVYVMPSMPAMPPMPGMTPLQIERFYADGNHIGVYGGQNFRVITDSTGDGMARVIIIQDNGDSTVIFSPEGQGYQYLYGSGPDAIALEELRKHGAEWEMNAAEWEEWAQKWHQEWEQNSKQWEEQWKDQEKQWQQYGEQWKEQAQEWKENEKHWRDNERQWKYAEKEWQRHEGLYRMKPMEMEELREHLQGLNGKLDEELAHGHMYGLMAPRVSMQHALVEDGLIEPGEEAEIQLTPDKMKINGKKVDDETHRKYLEMYERQQGVELSGNSRVEFKTKSRRSM
jgi:hypothetical protein